MSTKRQSSTATYGVGLVAVGMCLALILSGTYSGSSAAPAEKVVIIGVNGGWTGPAGTTGAPIFNGVMDYLKYTNDHGGIKGIRVKAIWEDSQGLIPKQVLAHRRFREKRAIVETVCSSGGLETLAPTFQKEQIPCFIPVVSPREGSLIRNDGVLGHLLIIQPILQA